MEWTAELSREIPWYEEESGKVVHDKIVRRFSLLCNPDAPVRGCALTVVSFPLRNCVDRANLGKQPLQLLETVQAGVDVDLFDSGKHSADDLSVLQRGQNSLLVEFTSHELHQSKNSILITYRGKFGPRSGTKVPVKITGVESGVGRDNYLYVGGDEVVKFDYRQMPPSTVCIMKMQNQEFVAH
jgi:hypothetical protein